MDKIWTYNFAFGLTEVFFYRCWLPLNNCERTILWCQCCNTAPSRVHCRYQGRSEHWIRTNLSSKWTAFISVWIHAVKTWRQSRKTGITQLWCLSDYYGRSFQEVSRFIVCHYLFDFFFFLVFKKMSLGSFIAMPLLNVPPRGFLFRTFMSWKRIIDLNRVISYLTIILKKSIELQVQGLIPVSGYNFSLEILKTYISHKQKAVM